VKKGVFVIAEAGVNHNGDLRRALGLVDAARACGADAVKFQTFTGAELVSPRAPKADYQKAHTGEGGQAAMLRSLELDDAAHRTLLDRCGEAGIAFLSTPFSERDVERLHALGLETFKIPSGEITNLPYLRAVARRAGRAILSTGMSDLGEVGAALEALEVAGLDRKRVTVLHCTTEYPAPFDEVNLRAMAAMGREFGVAFGYSDHTRGIAISIAAAALGASVIEKHLTLDRNLPGPDHQASLEPEEFARMVEGIRQVEAALGDGVKRVTPSERKNRIPVRKSIVARTAIAKGTPFSAENLAALRPGDGLSPMRWDAVLGRIAERDYEAYEPIAL
jgi:N-acetylneuraminate synthase